MKRIACITGATAGIGEATARLLAIYNFSLILCGRRKERLESLAAELSGSADRAASVYKGIKPLSAGDVADLVLFAVTRPPHVVVADMVLFPLAQASVTVVNRN